MTLFFDENLSFRLVRALAQAYSGSRHVRDVGLFGASDSEIWAWAAENGFLIVSKDVDFYQRSVLFGAPPKVIWLRIGNGPAAAAAMLLQERRDTIQAFVDDPSTTVLSLRGFSRTR